MKRIILGSASPRRRELLEQIEVEFEVATSDRDEIYTHTLPEEIVQELAQMKAENVASDLIEQEGSLTNAIVIGADTIVVRDSTILGKPTDEEDAFHILNSLQSRSHQVYTGVAFLIFDESGNKNAICHAEKTDVYVHAMSNDEIWKYISTGDPMDKAGAYGIQGCFAAYIDKINGDYYNVVGLPISYVYQTLKKYL